MFRPRAAHQSPQRRPRQPGAPSSGPVATAPLVSHATAVSFKRASPRIPCSSTRRTPGSRMRRRNKTATGVRLRKMVEHDLLRDGCALVKPRHQGRHAVNVIKTQTLPPARRRLPPSAASRFRPGLAQRHRTPLQTIKMLRLAARRLADLRFARFPQPQARQPAPPHARWPSASCSCASASPSPLRSTDGAHAQLARTASQPATPPTTRTAAAANRRLHRRRRPDQSSGHAAQLSSSAGCSPYSSADDVSASGSTARPYTASPTRHASTKPLERRPIAVAARRQRCIMPRQVDRLPAHRRPRLKPALLRLRLLPLRRLLPEPARPAHAASTSAPSGASSAGCRCSSRAGPPRRPRRHPPEPEAGPPPPPATQAAPPASAAIPTLKPTARAAAKPSSSSPVPGSSTVPNTAWSPSQPASASDSRPVSRNPSLSASGVAAPSSGWSADDSPIVETSPLAFSASSQ